MVRPHEAELRDYRKLRAFELADQLALATYRITATFPNDEKFGLTSQMRRAAVSTASNIVEGSGRDSTTEYLRFLDIAFGSAREVEYQASLAHRLGFVSDSDYPDYAKLAAECNRVLAGLIRSLRN